MKRNRWFEIKRLWNLLFPILLIVLIFAFSGCRKKEYHNLPNEIFALIPYEKGDTIIFESANDTVMVNIRERDLNYSRSVGYFQENIFYQSYYLQFSNISEKSNFAGNITINLEENGVDYYCDITLSSFGRNNLYYSGELRSANKEIINTLIIEGNEYDNLYKLEHTLDMDSTQNIFLKSGLGIILQDSARCYIPRIK